MKKLPLVEIEWSDAASHGGWRDTRRVQALSKGTLTIMTVGYIVRKTREEIAVAQSRSQENDSVNDVISIPRSSVVHIRRLKGK